MVLDGFMRETPWLDAAILATDIDTNVLNHARQGIFSDTCVSTIPKNYRDRYINSRPGPNGTRHQVKKRIRDLVDFNELNLFQQ